MEANPPPPLPSSPRRRSLLVTLVGWLVIAISALGLPISVITGLMIIAKSYGTETIDIAGFLTIVVGPPAGIITGIALLRRHRWARWFLIVGLATMLGSSLYQTAYPKPQVVIRTTKEGVTTTLLPPYPANHWPVIAFCAGFLFVLFLPRVRADFQQPARTTTDRTPSTTPPPPPNSSAQRAEKKRGWRVGHRGRDMMYYEEWRDGDWQRLDIDGEMLCGRAHHVIYFTSPSAWNSKYPSWAHGRRDEILARIKSEFRPPDYEYHGDEGSPAGTTPPLEPPSPAIPGTAPAVASVAAPPVLMRPPRERRGGLLLAVVALLAVTAGAGWLANQGIQNGQTRLPVKFGAQRRPIVRVEDPALFWTSIGIYSAAALGTLGLAAWLLKEGFAKKT